MLQAVILHINSLGQTVDSSVCCMLAVCLRVLHWLTHFVNVNITLDSIMLFVIHPRPLVLP